MFRFKMVFVVPLAVVPTFAQEHSGVTSCDLK